MNRKWRIVAWTALVLQIPFELNRTLLGLSNLQWTFLALAALSAPLLYAQRQKLIHDRTLQAAALFVAIQWAAAMYAPEFNANAIKAAIRFSAGLLLLAMARAEAAPLTPIWTIAAVLAAVYAMIAQAGLGIPWLFREGEFFIAQVQRLSGSFGYPNTAAAYFSMSLPLVWSSLRRPLFRWSAAILLWCALILTFSRGAAAAVLIAAIAGILLSWRNLSDRRMPAGLMVSGIAASFVTVPFTPYFTYMFTRWSTSNPPAALYTPAWNALRQQPDVPDQIPLRIQNLGTIPWLAKGRGQVALGYRWRNKESRKLALGAEVTNLPRDVQPGETIVVAADFRTPKTPGKYSLIVELFVRDFDWLSSAGVAPVVIEADIEPGATRSEGLGLPNPGSLHPIRAGAGAPTGPVPRMGLWKAAGRIFVAHPLGVGPDNYRLQYGKFLGLASWNTNIYSNSLYLELLTGSGLLGLAGFLLIVISIRPRATAAYLALVVFLVHGLVDVFLMTTPIYFAFWILVGTTDA
jgi:O-antigen ligase